jgi:hypothetical protein
MPLPLTMSLELSPGQPKLRSTDIAKDAAQVWKMMTPESKKAATDPLLEELVSSREEADTKPKIAPVHVLNNVSATMAKINHEVCPCNAVNARTLANVTHHSWMPCMPVWASNPLCLESGRALTTIPPQWSMLQVRRYQHFST